MIAMEGMAQDHLNIREFVFIIYALGELEQPSVGPS
jgi:hypothetical protein